LFTIWKLSTEPNFISGQALFLSLPMAGFSYSLYMFNHFLKKSIKEKKQLDDVIAKQEKEALITKNELAGIKAQQLENQLHFKNKELVSKVLM
ncbi:MAG: hypothetical protein L3J31_04795, partial [Bacteroidales bacterium]|nr:hypothetical protein [Bacteroidales bacterium]